MVVKNINQLEETIDSTYERRTEVKFLMIQKVLAISQIYGPNPIWGFFFFFIYIFFQSREFYKTLELHYLEYLTFTHFTGFNKQSLYHLCCEEKLKRMAFQSRSQVHFSEYLRWFEYVQVIGCIGE